MCKKGTKNGTVTTAVTTMCKKGRKNGTVTTAAGWEQERGRGKKKGELQSYRAVVLLNV